LQRQWGVPQMFPCSLNDPRNTGGNFPNCSMSFWRFAISFLYEGLSFIPKQYIMLRYKVNKKICGLQKKNPARIFFIALNYYTVGVSISYSFTFS